MTANPTVDAGFWDALAERYAAKPIENLDAYHRKLEITKARLRSDDVILDVGCGTGSLALELAPLVAHVHALDVSSEMLRIARRKAEAQDQRNLSLHQGTLDALAHFEPGALDGICAYNILHLLEDRPAALARMYALLKPGGFLIASTMCLGGSWVPYRPMLSVMRWLGKAPLVSVMRTEAHLAEIRDAGFEKLRTPDVGAKATVAFVVAEKPASGAA